MISRSVFRPRVLKSIEEMRDISWQWSDLHHRCPYATPFQRPEWLLPWIEAFSPQPMVAIAVRLENRLVGFAPFLMYRRESDIVLAFMGGGISDYLDVMVDPAYETQVVTSIQDALAGIPDWTLLELTDLPSGSAVLRAGSFETVGTEHDICSALSLPSLEAGPVENVPGKDALLHLFSKRQRANLRNARSRLRRMGEALIEIAVPETLPAFLDDLFRLHTTRWSQTGQAGILEDERIRDFHVRSAPLLLERGVLRLYRLRLGSRTLAVIYSLFERETVFCYMQGFDPEFGFCSPGTQLMFAVIEDAVRLGRRKFDFLRGQEAYKQHWHAVGEPTYCVQLARSVFYDRTSTYARIA